MSKQLFGMIGLGVMGQNFALNVARNGFSVAVYDINADAVNGYLQGKASGQPVKGADSLRALVTMLARPRRIMLLVPAGKAVDAVIDELSGLLDPGDLIIDGGNSYFKESERRAVSLQARGIHFLGMGVSGGEEGALWGPSLMPGGALQAYRDVEGIMTAVAARAEEDDRPCVTYIGPRGAGHFVKMVHNGIEYGDMQLIAEAYFLLKRALGLEAAALSDIFSQWNAGELSSFLIEITAKIFARQDAGSGQPLIDVILDKAKQKGTGKWTSQIALDMGSAVPTITAAVDGRILSSLKDQRTAAAAVLKGPSASYDGDAQALIDAVGDALYASKICSYAQGMSLLDAASREYDYDLNPGAIAGIWRAGCIIRARLLNDITEAYRRDPQLPNLLMDDHFRDAIHTRQAAWRRVVVTAVQLGVPLPGMSASLAYFDAYRCERLPANLIQAQRDFFGAHTFERTDKPGSFHEDWDA